MVLNHHKYMRLLSTLLFLFFATLSSTTVAAEMSGFVHLSDRGERLQKGDLSELKRLRFLTALDYPPFNYLVEAGRLSGFNVDLARALCETLGIADRCQIQGLPWDELQSSLNSGGGEAIIAGLSADRDTRRTLGFTRPYLRLTARFVTLKNAPLTVPDGLEAMTIGVIANSSHEKMLRSYFPKSKVATFGSPEALYANLRESKVGAIFGDGTNLSFWLAGDVSKNCCTFSGDAYFSDVFLGNGMRIATKAGDAELEKSLNFALKSVEEKGLLDELYLKYFPIGFY